MDWKSILSKITAHIDDGIFVVDKFGKVLYYNASAHNQAGVSFQNAIGKHILELFPKLSYETSTLLRVMETGMPIVGDIQSYYNHSLRKVTIITNTYPLFEEDQIVGALEISKDMILYGDINEKITQIAKESGLSITSERAIYGIDDILCHSQVMCRVKDRIKKIAVSEASVMVTGETGTGKELVVQSIHNLSRRRSMPFIAQNCAAIPVTLLESLLFGTTEGGFTGSRDSVGLFELADGGTLFLDEINSMDLTLQAKLLRVIQDGHIRRIGDRYVRKVDVRVIVAMNIPASQALEEGKLRRDLFYRLNVLSVEVPALRDREDDQILLAEQFVKKYSASLQKHTQGFSFEVKRAFETYPWPGNVRELEHAIEQAVLLSEGEILKLEDLPATLQNCAAEICDGEKDSSPDAAKPLKAKLEAYEKTVIETALKTHGYVVKQTAMQLGVPRQTLYNRIAHLGIDLRAMNPTN